MLKHSMTDRHIADIMICVPSSIVERCHTWNVYGEQRRRNHGDAKWGVGAEQQIGSQILMGMYEFSILRAELPPTLV